jgi:hypothetical protein
MAAQAAAVAPVPAPELGLVRGQTLVVTGAGFRASEHVTVTLTSFGIRIRHGVASNGRFRLDFGAVPAARCAPLRVVAIGSRGSHAQIVLPRHICLQPQPVSPNS